MSTNEIRTPQQVLAAIDAARRPRQRPQLPNTYEAPQDLVERALAELFGDILNFSSIGRNDNLFALGCSSLHLTQIASRIRTHFGVSLSFASFFADPTLCAVARRLRVELGLEEAMDAEPSVRFSLGAPATEGDEWTLEPIQASGTALPVSSVVVPSQARPAQLVDCVRELVANLTRYGHSCELIVADSTSDESIVEQVRCIVAKLSKDSGRAIRYVGLRERRQFRERLESLGADRSALEFALGRDTGLPSPGCNRNLLTLLTAGQLFVSVDDDTRCLYARSQRFRPVLEPGPLAETIQCFPDRAALVDSLSLRSLDFVRVHSQLLGQSSASLGIRGDDGRIQITVGGVAGDCGWGSPDRYLAVNPASLTPIQSSAEWTIAVTCREMLRVSAHYQVTDHAPLLMTTAFGADNREILPPFVPVGRGSDQVLGHLLPAIDTRARFGHLPWAVLHTPSGNRRFWPGELLRGAGTVDIATMFCALLPPRQSPQGLTLATLGTHLRDLGRRGPRSFAGALGDCVRQYRHRQLSALEARSAEVEAELPHWAKDARAFLAAARSGMCQMQGLIPAELLYERELDQAIDTARQLVLNFGDLLEAWPGIAMAAIRLQEQ